MTSSKRGVCWVVENSVFAGTPSKEKITMNHEGNTKVIQDEFQRLGCQVVRHSNLTATQLMKEAERMAALDHSQHDCFVCVVRSRGEGSDKILCSDRAAVGVQDLMDVFNATRCPSLAGKPKVFYVLISRGDERQGGVDFAGQLGSERHPDGADFLLVHTALASCFHARKSRDGVPFHLPLLAGVLQRHARTQDLVTCLAMANGRYARLRGTAGSYYTAPITSTLRKALVFRELP